MIQIYSKRILTVIFIFSILFIGSSAVSADVLQTQESDQWEGIEVDLLSMKVRNSIITVKFKLRNVGPIKHSIQIPFENCFIMDETNQKKYYPLKDSDGLYIAGPKYDKGNGGRFWFDIHPDKSRGMWIKFPEPADNPETITISIPGIFPFEEIPLEQ